MGFTEESKIQPLPTPSFSLHNMKIQSEMKAIFLTTTKIPDHHLWANGLFQNVFVIYTMLEAAGYQPFFFVDSAKSTNGSELHKSIRVIDMEGYTRRALRRLPPCISMSRIIGGSFHPLHH